MSNDKKVVWVLGAGFSRSLGGPLLSDLFTWESLQDVFRTYGDLGYKRDLERIVRTYLFGVYDVSLSDASLEQVTYQGGVFKEYLWKHSEEFLERLDIAAQPNAALAEIELMTRTFANANVNRSGGDQVKDNLETASSLAKRLLAAECDKFLVNTSTEQEKWRPYKKWAGQLKARNIILTFNYEGLLDLLSNGQSGFRVFLPGNIQDYEKQTQIAPIILKLHGSVSWYIGSSKRDGSKYDVEEMENYDHGDFLKNDIKSAIATPGVTKQSLIETTQLSALWNFANDAIQYADAVVFIGYRFPPSDAYSRDEITSRIRDNNNYRKQYGLEPLFVHTVLGDDVNHADSRRIRGLLLASGCTEKYIVQYPMFAEDFLGSFDHRNNDYLFRNIYNDRDGE